MMKPIIKPFSEKKGGVLVIFAIALIAMMGMAGLAVDVAHLYGVKSQLQVAADAAALAGANVLTGPTAATDAAAAATTVGAANYADVAAPDAANAGQAIPVTLNPGDISTGNWNGATFTENGNPLNAVRVVARRTGASGQPMVVNWLIRVMSLLPGNSSFSRTGVSAVAIAARDMNNLVPIAVNEYWGKPNPYPHSYMRSKDIDPAQTPGYAGQTFGILGADANDSRGGASPNSCDGYVYLDWRNPIYDGSGLWYGASETGSGDCATGLTQMIPQPTGNADNSVKNGPYFYYLFNGIPDTMVPPIAVPEPYNSGTGSNKYPNNQASVYLNNPLLTPESPPYATTTYFNSSGNEPKLPQGPGGERFCDRWPVGSKIMVMVYDGGVSGNVPNAVTIVGYGVIQIDGYANHWNGNPSSFNSSGNTAYGHALNIKTLFPSLASDSHLSDPYIIQHVPNESCDSFLSVIKQVQLPQVRLVDSNEADMHYGMTTH